MVEDSFCNNPQLSFVPIRALLKKCQTVLEIQDSICKSFTIYYLHIKRQKSDCVDSMKSQTWEDLTFLTLLNWAGNKKCQLQMAKKSLYLIRLKRKSHSEFRHGTSLLYHNLPLWYQGSSLNGENAERLILLEEMDPYHESLFLESVHYDRE